MDLAPSSATETDNASSAASLGAAGGGAPHPGTVYRLNDEHLLFVRTEKRPEAKEPEHLFVKTRARGVFMVWLSEVPKEAELVIDTDGRKTAQDMQIELQIERWNLDLTKSLLTKACSWLPRMKARELRVEYTEKRAQLT